jgi:hypothetical protein
LVAKMAFEQFGACRVQVTIQPLQAKHSDAQRGYYRGMVLPDIYTALCQWGNDDYDIDDVHEQLMEIADLPVRQMKDRHGNPIGKPKRSTSRLDKQEFSEFLEKVIRWAAERNIHIRDAVPYGSIPEKER